MRMEVCKCTRMGKGVGRGVLEGKMSKVIRGGEMYNTVYFRKPVGIYPFSII